MKKILLSSLFVSCIASTLFLYELSTNRKLLTQPRFIENESVISKDMNVNSYPRLNTAVASIEKQAKINFVSQRSVTPKEIDFSNPPKMLCSESRSLEQGGGNVRHCEVVYE